MTSPFAFVLSSTLIETSLPTAAGAVVETVDGDEFLALFTDPVELFGFDESGAQESIAGEEAIPPIVEFAAIGTAIAPLAPNEPRRNPSPPKPRIVVPLDR
jgi:hypothetical protein